MLNHGKNGNKIIVNLCEKFRENILRFKQVVSSIELEADESHDSDIAKLAIRLAFKMRTLRDIFVVYDCDRYLI